VAQTSLCTEPNEVLDALIIDAWFSGAHQLHRLRGAGTLLLQVDSWYLGANLPGEGRELAYQTVVRDYLDECEESRENGYSGFEPS
jgi:hypothetical protein